MKRIAIALLATGSLAAADPATVAAAAPGPLAPHPYEAFLGARIQRTMTLLATSTRIQRNPVRVLFYGQSIVAGAHVSRAFTAWAAKEFPHAKVEIENRAIGGYTAPTLVRTARQDVAPFYPDLVCFHVYDGHDSGELERIVSDIRRFTTAELLMWTHHQDHYGPDGTERDKSRDDASAFRRMLAQKYNAELVEVREEWKQWLAQNPQFPRKDLLVDNIHLNGKGGALMSEMVLRHCRFNPLFPSWWASMVRTYEARRPLEERSDEIRLDGAWKRHGVGAGTSAAGTMTLRFHGNRVVADLLAVGGKQGTLEVLVDGKPPSAHPDCYTVTRPTGNPLNASRPMVNRILSAGAPVAEDWNLALSEVSEDGKSFKFSVTGTVSGADGEGSDKDEVFTSRSGRLTFRPAEITAAAMAAQTKKPFPREFTAKFSTVLLGADSVRCPDKLGEGELNRVVLVQGIANGEHTLELRAKGDGPVAVRELIVHRPPLE